jgi:ABC-type Zn uptake system ZnuABC Zn-binding protein ZnuA
MRAIRITRRTDHADEEHRREDDEHEDGDPHVWTDPEQRADLGGQH